jgi:2,3,4,5-tetrahydropyridine-2,6-dicarboxylate N-succinyltransferase
MSSELAPHIEAAWERRDQLSPQSKGADVEAIEAALDLLDSGQARVATRASDGRWETHQWLKKAVLLSFRISANQLIGAASGNGDASPGP